MKCDLAQTHLSSLLSSSQPVLRDSAVHSPWSLRPLIIDWNMVLEKTLEGPLDSKEIQPVNPKGNQSWIFIGRTDGEAPILWPPDAKSRLIGKDPDVGRLRAGRKGGNRGWDACMASLTPWTWIWANSGRCWRTGKPGVLQSMELQRVGYGHDLVTKQQW